MSRRYSQIQNQPDDHQDETRNDRKDRRTSARLRWVLSGVAVSVFLLLLVFVLASLCLGYILSFAEVCGKDAKDIREIRHMIYELRENEGGAGVGHDAPTATGPSLPPLSDSGSTYIGGRASTGTSSATATGSGYGTGSTAHSSGIPSACSPCECLFPSNYTVNLTGTPPLDVTVDVDASQLLVTCYDQVYEAVQDLLSSGIKVTVNSTQTACHAVPCTQVACTAVSCIQEPCTPVECIAPSPVDCLAVECIAVPCTLNSSAIASVVSSGVSAGLNQSIVAMLDQIDRWEAEMEDIWEDAFLNITSGKPPHRSNRTLGQANGRRKDGINYVLNVECVAVREPGDTSGMFVSACEVVYGPVPSNSSALKEFNSTLWSYVSESRNSTNCSAIVTTCPTPAACAPCPATTTMITSTPCPLCPTTTGAVTSTTTALPAPTPCPSPPPCPTCPTSAPSPAPCPTPSAIPTCPTSPPCPTAVPCPTPTPTPTPTPRPTCAPCPTSAPATCAPCAPCPTCAPASCQTVNCTASCSTPVSGSTTDPDAGGQPPPISCPYSANTGVCRLGGISSAGVVVLVICDLQDIGCYYYLRDSHNNVLNFANSNPQNIQYVFRPVRIIDHLTVSIYENVAVVPDSTESLLLATGFRCAQQVGSTAAFISSYLSAAAQVFGSLGVTASFTGRVNQGYWTLAKVKGLVGANGGYSQCVANYSYTQQILMDTVGSLYRNGLANGWAYFVNDYAVCGYSYCSNYNPLLDLINLNLNNGHPEDFVTYFASGTCAMPSLPL